MSKYRVVVVGAGASGIAAATRLMKSGVNDIIVLEAENRIGGRVFTTEFGENEVDMGAQWVHGEKNNVVYEMAEPHDLLESSSSHYPETSFVTSAGELVSSTITEKLMTLLAQINESAMKDLEGFHGSLGDYFTKEFNDKLDLEENKGTVDRKLASSLLEWYHKFENSIDASESWFETSGKGHLEYWECEGNPLLSWKNGGYSNVFNLLAWQRRITDTEKVFMKQYEV
ncbi:hypothetical protein J437_LFUL017565 [Ladona fulva]|uniref:Amine oxidase domain-containing protein n=1 Tax=Ladona fulva TaxID=123851 RepID=A0A8K0P691_LADFU|nr:hypothetical protein J437_LFUL017565 [Ladona fulva]